MKAHYKTSNGRLTFEVTGETVKEVFEQVGSIQEVFDAESTCGCCKSPDIKFLVRHVEDYIYYELQCKVCAARFSFGQNKKGGGLFPKRKDKEGAVIPNRGWVKFVSEREARATGGDDHMRDEDVPF